MKEKPILFNGEMIRAVLDGRKTQTRRVVKPDAPYVSTDEGLDILWATDQLRCPYGQPGDTLWVRETWATPGNYDHIKPSKLADTCFTRDELAYRATEQHGDVYYKWRPSIFMPRWASRITLRVVSVRVERVQDIIERDCVAEGICANHPLPVDAFRELWDSINAKRGFSWASNPWVWVVEFQKVE